jgi:predicted dehydrogenase
MHCPFLSIPSSSISTVTVIELNLPSPLSIIGDKFRITTKVNEHLDDALNDPNIDLVIIATPSHLRFGMAEVSLPANRLRVRFAVCIHHDIQA